MTLGIVAFHLVLTSCTSVQMVEKAPRQSIRFANAEAADTFYQALITKITPGNDTNDVTVGLWLPLPYRHSTVPSDDLQFNREAAKADSSGNGVISLAEAREYSESIGERSEA